jgi:predicted  nucleic acid-binding Zn ribbon protein
MIAADGYALPIPTTATIALLDLRRLNALGAWVQVEFSAQVSNPDSERAKKEWDAARTEFKSGGVSLYDVPRLGGENFARSQAAATPFFTRDMAL